MTLRLVTSQDKSNLDSSPCTDEGHAVKPASDFIHDLPGRRFTGWGIAVAVLGTLIVAFLVVGPVVEKNSYLGALDDLESEARLSRGLLTLCNTSTHMDALNDRIAKKPLPRRLIIAQISAELDCLAQLRPAFQAEHHLHTGGIGSVASAIALGPKAVEPAIVALESENTEVRARAAKVLVALDEFVNEDRRTRIKTRIGGLIDEGILPLRQSLGLAPLLPPTDVPSKATALPGTAEDDDEGLGLGTGAFRLRLDLPVLPLPTAPAQPTPPPEPDPLQPSPAAQAPEPSDTPPSTPAEPPPAPPSKEPPPAPKVLYDREAAPRLQMPEVPEKPPKKEEEPLEAQEDEEEPSSVQEGAPDSEEEPPMQQETP